VSNVRNPAWNAPEATFGQGFDIGHGTLDIGQQAHEGAGSAAAILLVDRALARTVARWRGAADPIAWALPRPPADAIDGSPDVSDSNQGPAEQGAEGGCPMVQIPPLNIRRALPSLSTTEAGLDTAQPCYSSTEFGASGGLLGFAPDMGEVTIDNFTLKTDRDANGSFETTEHLDSFTLDSTGYAPDSLLHDAAGNLTYDGNQAFVYDAWNRMISVAKAFRTTSDNGSGGVTLGSLQLGSVLQTNTYDGAGRRIVKAVTNSADLDATYHHYYNPGGHSLLEERTGSGWVIKQYAWGLTYIDELIQVAHNSDPADNTSCETAHLALHNANFNVMALIEASSGAVAERYEYTPYGQRTVYISPGSNDPLAMAPVRRSQRITVASVSQPYGLNDFGHQGLLHEHPDDLVYNRARVLHVRLGRFAQRDQLEYVDGLSFYCYARSNAIGHTDSFGYLPFPGITLDIPANPFKCFVAVAATNQTAILTGPVNAILWGHYLNGSGHSREMSIYDFDPIGLARMSLMNETISSVRSRTGTYLSQMQCDETRTLKGRRMRSFTSPHMMISSYELEARYEVTLKKVCSSSCCSRLFGRFRYRFTATDRTDFNNNSWDWYPAALGLMPYKIYDRLIVACGVGRSFDIWASASSSRGSLLHQVCAP
jgi:RHS repeat-associated protein